MHILIAVLIFCLPTTATANVPTTCTKQIYSDMSTEPNYECPSPGEEFIVPKMKLKTSVVLDPTDKLKNKIPWPGILIDKNRMLVIGLRIKGLRRLRYLDMKTMAEELDNLEKYLEARCGVDTKFYNSQIIDYKNRIISLHKDIEASKKWDRSGPFWVIAGITTASVVATTLVLVWTTKK